MKKTSNQTFALRFMTIKLFLIFIFTGVSISISQTPIPIYVTGMVHIDPLPSDVHDTTIVIRAYDSHRIALLWYVDFANQTGLRLSAQMTGVYAEACIHRGHASDFISFMPGRVHHLGTHAHANVKAPVKYLWRTIANQFYHNPDSVKKIMTDNIPWVNQVFTSNGFTSADNWFFHGSHGTFFGMDTILFRYPQPNPYPYNNDYKMAGAVRGGHYVYRGGFLTEPNTSSDTSYIKFPEVGGIIGFDELHGPEGMVYGTFPYQKRDFLRVYIEWRESVRRGEARAVRFFSWMIHPYQLIHQVKGTDGRSPRIHIQEFVAWLEENFIGHTDESGNVIARFANAGEIRSAYESWRAMYPQYDQLLQSTIARGQRPLYFPGIFGRLETTYHDQKIATPDTNLVIHRMIDRVLTRPVYLAWSRSGSRALEPTLTGWFKVTRGDSSTQVLHSNAITISPEPVLLEPTSSIGVDESAQVPLAYSLYQNYPNPFNPSTTIQFSIPSSQFVTLKVYDLLGREIATLVNEELNPGEYSIVLDATGLASGIYFYRLSASSFIETKKMLIGR